MTNEAQAARSLIDSALKTHAAIQALGIGEAQLADTLKLGKAAADFLAPQRRAGVILLPQFEKVHERGEHIITMDVANGIEWDVREFEGKRMDAAQFKQACIDLRTGDHADWWRPTRRELSSLINDTRYNPAIDKEFFPNAKTDWYRTRTPYAPYSGFRWGVYFDDGRSDGLGDDYGCFVRAVRASQ